MAFVAGIVPVTKQGSTVASCNSFVAPKLTAQVKPLAAESVVMSMMYGPRSYRASRARASAPTALHMSMLGPYFGRSVVPRKQGATPSPIQLLNEAERMLTNPFEFFDLATREAMWTPQYGFDENEKEFVLTIEAPGIPKEQISLEIKDDILTVSGGMETKEKKEGEKGQVESFQSRSFRRSLRVGSGVDQEKIRAAVKDGIIRVRMPKIEEEAVKTRKIELEEEHEVPPQ